MSFRLVRLRPETYVDSVQLMMASRAMQGQPGVDWATAVMGTPANVEILAGEAFDDPAMATAGANDLVLAVRAASREMIPFCTSRATSSEERECGFPYPPPPPAN